jgi:hypothetical protein
MRKLRNEIRSKSTLGENTQAIDQAAARKL